MYDEGKEFVGETRETAIDRAAAYFGVPTTHVDVRVLSDLVEIAGLGGNVMIVAIVQEPAEADDPQGELGPVAEFAKGVLERMELGGRTRVEESADGEEGETVLRLRGEAVSEVARRDDRFLGALSHVVERAMEKLTGSEGRVHIQVGLDDPGELRLERQARERAQEVERTGNPVTLDPMNSRERWIVHNALREVEGVRSQSVGDGRFKRVKIMPR